MLWMCSKWLNFRIKKLNFRIRQKMIKNNFILIPQWINFRIKNLHFRIRQKIEPFDAREHNAVPIAMNINVRF